jgi:hypothetical protein
MLSDTTYFKLTCYAPYSKAMICVSITDELMTQLPPDWLVILTDYLIDEVKHKPEYYIEGSTCIVQALRSTGNDPMSVLEFNRILYDNI